MLRSPDLAEADSLAALFAILFQSDCWWCTEENKTKRLCVQMQIQQKKRSKRKGNDVFKETTMNYDVQSSNVCAITSFDGFV